MCVVSENDAVFSVADTGLMLKRADALKRKSGTCLRSCSLSSGSVFTDRPYLRIARSSRSSKTSKTQMVHFHRKTWFITTDLSRFDKNSKKTTLNSYSKPI